MIRRTTVALGLLALGLCSRAATAADHRDGTAVMADPSTDINDLFAWMSADGTKIYLAMTVFPAADKTVSPKFSNNAAYVFHINSKAGLGISATAAAVVCTFDAAQK